MPLKTSGGSAYLAALFPPGNLAARINELRREILLARGVSEPLPFPCAAPLAWFESRPPLEVLARLARDAPRVYDRLRTDGGSLFLAPSGEPAAQPPALPLLAEPPLPAGRGFPLAWFSDAESARSAAAVLPPPPRLAFRTFEAVLLRVSWGDPWRTALVWETEAVLRYPLRRTAKLDQRIPRGP